MDQPPSKLLMAADTQFRMGSGGYPSYKTSETGEKFTCFDLIVSASSHCVNSGRNLGDFHVRAKIPKKRVIFVVKLCLTTKITQRKGICMITGLLFPQR